MAATVFVGTSNIGGGNGVKEPKGLNTPLTENPFVKFHNRQRGYVRCAATPKEGKSDYVITEEVTKPGGAADVRARSSSKPTMSASRRRDRERGVHQHASVNAASQTTLIRAAEPLPAERQQAPPRFGRSGGGVSAC